MTTSPGNRRRRPGHALGVRLGVLALMVVAIVAMIWSGVSPETAVAVACAGGLGAAEVASRLLGPADKGQR